MKKASSRVVVDRLEGGIAVLVVYDDEDVKFNLPARFLPEGVKGGDHLKLTFVQDRPSRQEAEKKVKDLLAELKGDAEK